MKTLGTRTLNGIIISLKQSDPAGIVADFVVNVEGSTAKDSGHKTPMRQIGF